MGQLQESKVSARSPAVWARLSIAGICLATGFMAGAMGLRAAFVLQHPDTSPDRWHSVLLVVHKDAPLFVALCALLWVVTRLRSRWLAVAFRIGVVGLLLLYAIDVAMIKLMGTRLSWGRFVTFLPQPEIVFNFLREQFGLGRTLGLLAGFVGGLGAICAVPVRRSRGGDRVLMGAAAAGLLLAFVPVDNDYVLRWNRENIFALNGRNGESRRYSAPEAARLMAEYRLKLAPRTVTGAPQRKNVIFLLVESLSNYQSREFGGVHDWTPEIDAIARANTRFTRFHASGYCTAEGLMYLFCGVNLWLPFAGAAGSEASPVEAPAGRTLPGVFARAGYATAFLTTGPLGFAGKGAWLKTIGFEYMEGHQHPFYQGWPRLTFKAAPDEALYRRSLEWMRNQKKAPWFLTVETVSSHIPYLDPKTGQPDVEASFRYADHWAGWFVRQLEAEGFFQEGVLIITGDHRAMVPVEPGEKAKLGAAYTALVPFVIVDRSRPAGERIDALYKQGDVVPSFRQWLGESVTLGAFNASLFEPPRDNVALHRRGNEFGVVDVFLPEGEGQVRVAGDDTEFLWRKNISDERRRAVLALIAAERQRIYQSAWEN
jgi:hypothetical protein